MSSRGSLKRQESGPESEEQGAVIAGAEFGLLSWEDEGRD